MASPVMTRDTAASDESAAPCRVILLLDLDCFYAQCERVRLGLENDTTALALLQWNSVLAVTYPARGLYGIKRGDSWDQVQDKSNGKCLAIHLPLLTASDTTTTTATSDDSVEAAYEKVFQLSTDERQRLFAQEIGHRRLHSEGKACLERYRLASTRIFGVVLQALEDHLQDHFILERASIDELFIDVTSYCWNDDTRTKEQDEAVEQVMKQTKLVNKDNNNTEDDPSIEQALYRGAWVASILRAAVFHQLGFTLSAGVSTSKLTAKLGASYGKPNGQALILPSCIPSVMISTPLSKCRNLGGKIGKLVSAMLPENQTTMGAVAQHLSLPVLVEALGASTGQNVFDAARGMDTEAVKSTHNALVKSITAFKSFPKTNMEGIDAWLTLLATDIVRRIETDSHRNHRAPKSCTVHYSCSKPTTLTTRTSRSLRIPFPKDSEHQKMSVLVQRAKDAILSKEGNLILLYRLGLCAMDFEERGDISAFFKTEAKGTMKSEAAEKSCAAPTSSETTNDEELALKLQRQYDSNRSASIPLVVSEPLDKDLELARKLQQQYDREDNLFTILDRRPPPKKKPKIDSFFKHFRTK
jgi:DNA polymerase eta